MSERASQSMREVMLEQVFQRVNICKRDNCRMGQTVCEIEGK